MKKRLYHRTLLLNYYTTNHMSNVKSILVVSALLLALTISCSQESKWNPHTMRLNSLI